MKKRTIAPQQIAPVERQTTGTVAEAAANSTSAVFASNYGGSEGGVDASWMPPPPY